MVEQSWLVTKLNDLFFYLVAWDEYSVLGAVRRRRMNLVGLPEI